MYVIVNYSYKIVSNIHSLKNVIMWLTIVARFFNTT